MAKNSFRLAEVSLVELFLAILSILSIGSAASTVNPQFDPQSDPQSPADIFKINVHNYNSARTLNAINTNVRKVESEVKKLDTKLEDLKKEHENILTLLNLITNRLNTHENKLDQIINQTRPRRDSLNRNLQFDEDLHSQFGHTPNKIAGQPGRRRVPIANQRVLVGRSVQENDNHHDFVNEFIQSSLSWQDYTNRSLSKIMNVVAEIYKEDKQFGLDFNRLLGERANEDRPDLVDRMKKEFKEQFSVNKAELKSYIAGVNENCLRTKTQSENMTFLLLGIKDDLNNPLKLNSAKFGQENSVLPPPDEGESSKSALLDPTGLIGKSGDLACKSAGSLLNSTMEQLRGDLTSVKQQILAKIDKENARINERIYTLNNNYQHLNNLRNCNASLRAMEFNNVQADSSANEIESSPSIRQTHKTAAAMPVDDYVTRAASTSTFIPPFYQVPKKREEDSRSKSNPRTKLISPIKYGTLKKKGCYAPNIMSPSSCEDLYVDRVNCDGVYVILFKDEASRVYCEIEDGGGSTVFMRRGQFNDYPLSSFKQNWHAYQKGFGNIDADFWLGLDKLHQLTRNRNQMLEINLETFDGEQLTLRYNQFFVDDEANNYRLTVAEPTLNANYADLFLQHSGRPFVTSDRNDKHNCARKFEAGWWFMDVPQCHRVLLNGLFYNQNSSPMDKHGIQWPGWLKKQYLKAVQMKIRERKPAYSF